MSSLRDMTVEQYLAAVASDAPSPGGGAVAALVVAQAGALAAMAGRFSAGREGSDIPAMIELVAAADRLREFGGVLSDADAAAFEDYRRAVRLPREPDGQARAEAIREATSTAADVPLQTAEAAAEVGRLAVVLVEEGNRHLRGDAAAAALLASAAATTAALMVVENLAKRPEDPRTDTARDVAEAARASAQRALAQFPAMTVEAGS
ncbi:hypothetical protein Acsp06_63080 [Actinomycetospora sp. NBRC 106375]|uniref:cyclodeaminase/cyclohydrolase family protein n=1 Tax=Actinomycetospora sp. NBRC 106375 TaxID=3032207 RepID=UPI0024A13B1F|nr:cyclodeaminase/cyclohydrolase family protein [Actinomycetospora sp. NBRC 106375]GLZ50123.1 hypothetical protein Acsp06_63080 [Actinomycetospora sp. NBRC 106375]